MARENSPFIYGDEWLDKRKDGKSPHIWQVASYSGPKRSVVYRSTRCRELDDAIRFLKAESTRTEAAKPQDDSGKVLVAAQIMLYYEEHGQTTISADSVASCIRIFLAFLAQDEVTMACTYDQLSPAVFRRFVAWRRKPHAYKLRFKGRDYEQRSEGVNDATIKKGLRILSAALNHSVSEQRAKWCPQVPRKVLEGLQTGGTDRVLSIDELGALFGYARSDQKIERLVTLMLATAMRPDAARQFDPERQYTNVNGVRRLDLHPPDAPRTKKRNPIIPCIEPFARMIEDHKGVWVVDENGRGGAMTGRWDTMREALGFGQDVVAKTIRHTIATMLFTARVNKYEINMLMGHVIDATTSSKYIHLDPDFMNEAASGLLTIWNEVMDAADKWVAANVVANGPNGKRIVKPRPADLDVSVTKLLSRTEARSAKEADDARIARNAQINAARKARKETPEALKARSEADLFKLIAA